MKKQSYISSLALTCLIWVMGTAQCDSLVPLSDEFENSSTISDWQRINETEGWNADQLEVLDIDTTQPGRMTLQPHTVTWFNEYRGPLVYKDVPGDFVMTTSIHVSDLDPDQNLIPGSRFSLGGLMLRLPRALTNPVPGQPIEGDNYIFLSLGVGFQPSVNVQWEFEDKNTEDSDSHPLFTPSDSGNARLQIARIGNLFALLAQPEGGDWQVIRTFMRTDMAGPLQAGAVAYTDFPGAQIAAGHDPFIHNGSVFDNQGSPDIEAAYDYIRFAEIPEALSAVDLASLNEDDLHELLLSHLADNVDSASTQGLELQVSHFGDPSPGICSEDACSLREAILAANTSPGEDTISLTEGTFSLGISGRNEDAGETGDLDITDDVVIVGAGAELTVIDSNGLDRIFDVRPGARLRISEATVTSGLSRFFLGNGGGVRVEQGASLEIDNVIVRDNRARRGSAIWSNGSLNIFNSVIRDNSPSFLRFRSHGAISIAGGSASIADSVFQNNHGGPGGGMYTQGEVNITRSTFSLNHAWRGGAIYAESGSVQISNSTFSRNSASGTGGALFNQGATIELTNTTINENSADMPGGGISNGNLGSITLVNSMVASNPQGGDCEGNSIQSLGHNLFSDNSCPSNLINGDIINQNPMLDKLDQYGGVTPTVALLDGSPAINTGDNTVCNSTAVENIDQRGFIRTDGLVGNSQCDIGAFEWYPVANRQSPIGTNMGGIGSGSTLFPFTDVFRQSGRWRPVCFSGTGCPHPWNENNPNSDNPPPPVDVDENGWVMAIPTGSTPPTSAVRSYFFEGTANQGFAHGQYRVTYDGSGSIQYGGAASLIPNQPGEDGVDIIDVASGNQNAWLDITETDIGQTGDYIRNIRIVPVGFTSAAATNLFTPGFLEKARRFSVLRFMDWMRTNHSPPGLWSQRAKDTDARYSDGTGVPLEIMLQLSNQLQAAPWFTLPDMADDAYIEQFSAMVRDRLNSDLPVYIEYSNETWNGQFPQTQRVRDTGIAEFPDADNRVVAAANWQGRKTVEMCRIWDQVWGDQAQRLVCVNAARANPDAVGRIGGPGTPFVSSAEHVLSCPHWNDGPCDARNGVDAIAIAPYIGSYIGSDINGQTVLGWTNDGDGGLSGLFNELSQGNGLIAGGQPVTDGALQRSRDWMVQNKAIADAHSVEMVAYEGGQHLAGAGGDANNDGLVVRNNSAITSLFTSANRNSLMGEAYAQNFADWHEQGGCLFMNYTLAQAAYNRFGSWGIVEFIDEDSTPKFDAIQNFISNNPLPWNGCSPAATPP